MSINNPINEEIKRKIFSKENMAVFLAEDYCADKGVRYDRIVYDGVIDAEQFEGIVFLLKESVESGIIKDYTQKGLFAEDFDENGYWDFPATTRKESKIQETVIGENLTHWPNICYWVEAIRDPEKRYSAVSKGSDSSKNLSKIAIINLKKVAGKSSSDDKLFERIRENETYTEAIRTEINIINGGSHRVKLVVCGGTMPFEFAQKIYNAEVETLECGAQYFDVDNMIFLKFIHPSQRGAAADKAMPYAYMQTIIRELRKKRPNFPFD